MQKTGRLRREREESERAKKESRVGRGGRVCGGKCAPQHNAKSAKRKIDDATGEGRLNKIG